MWHRVLSLGWRLPVSLVSCFRLVPHFSRELLRAKSFSTKEFSWNEHHMPQLPQFLTRSHITRDMSGKKTQPGHRRLERRNAAKNFDYDASSSSPSFETSLVTRSLDLSDRTSFRVEGTDGEVDRICRSLGLSGPEDFAIPEAAWEARKIRSSSDLLPRSRLNGLHNPRIVEAERGKESELEDRASVVEGELGDMFMDSVRVREFELGPNDAAESKAAAAGGGGIKGVRPPLLKPPPGMRLPVVDHSCSTWDIFRDLAPENDPGSSSAMANYRGFNTSHDDEDIKEGIGGEATEEEETVSRIPENEVLSDCSFTTSADDDSSSTTISPNVRCRPEITGWTKGELLGRGSFGSVYSALSDLGFFFAVKEVSLLDQGSQGRQSILQLEQEIALLSKFEHENIVQYYGTEQCESKLFIFLELVTQGSLQKLYQKYRLLDSQVSAYTIQILQGLKYLHDQNVIHRDIKCANILVDVNGSVKLADFGLAKSTKLNDAKSCKGTAFWMAPEVVRGNLKGYGPPADIWSLGCTVLEMLTRQVPYPHLECMQAVFQIGRGVPPPVPDTLSKDSRDFILQCVQVHPNDRPSAAQLLNHPFVRRRLSASSGSASPHRKLWKTM